MAVQTMLPKETAFGSGRAEGLRTWTCEKLCDPFTIVEASASIPHHFNAVMGVTRSTHTHTTYHKAQ